MAANAQDIWNEFRQDKFIITDRVRVMINDMREKPERLRCIFLASSGDYGLSELLVHAYYDSRYELCKFLLDSGVNPNRVKRFINPEFTVLNNLFVEYGYKPETTEEYRRQHNELMSKYPFI